MGLSLRPAVHGALLTVACLFGGLLVGGLVGFAIFELLPGGDDFAHPPPLNVTLAALPALAGFAAGSAVWGVRMGRLAATGLGRCAQLRPTDGRAGHRLVGARAAGRRRVGAARCPFTGCSPCSSSPPPS